MNNNRSKRLNELSGIVEMMTNNSQSQKDLSMRLGVSPSQVSLWLSGKINIRMDTLIRLKEAVMCCKPVSGYAKRQPVDDGILQLCEAEGEAYGTTRTLGGLIKKAMVEKEIPQKTLAADVGSSQSRISEYIKGAVIPS